MEYSDIVYRGNCNVWFRGDCVQIVFPSIGCQKVPRCTMCNFGCYERNCAEHEAIQILKNGLEFFARSHSEYAFRELYHLEGRVPDIVLLLGTYGSILDKKEFGHLEKIFEYINGQSQVTAIRTIILETHYKTIDIEYLHQLKSMLRPNANNELPELFVEVGLESTNPAVQQTLKKKINLEKFAQTVSMLKLTGIGTIANVIFGAPSLSPAEQISDCIKTISWLDYLGVDEICLFPLNIWEGSTLWTDYTHGTYVRPSFYSLWRVLQGISPYALGKLSFSWYGDRKLHNPGWNTKQSVLPPDTGRQDLGFWVGSIERLQSFKDINDRVKFVDAVAYCMQANTWDDLCVKYSKYTYVPDGKKDFVTITPRILATERVNTNGRIYPAVVVQASIREEESKHE